MTAQDDLHEDLAVAVVRVGLYVVASELVEAAEDDDHTLPVLGDVADHLLGAGWSRPRVVTTAAELDELPDGAVLKHVGDVEAPDSAGLVVEAWNTAFGRRWALSGSGGLRRTSQMVGGAWLVVWSPPAETQGDQR